MRIRRWMVVPAFVGALALGGCAEEEGVGEEEGVVGEEVVGEGVVETAPVAPAAGVGAEAGAVGATEILGNGIDDDGDGLIDEEA